MIYRIVATRKLRNVEISCEGMENDSILSLTIYFQFKGIVILDSIPYRREFILNYFTIKVYVKIFIFTLPNATVYIPLNYRHICLKRCKTRISYGLIYGDINKEFDIKIIREISMDILLENVSATNIILLLLKKYIWMCAYRKSL